MDDVRKQFEQRLRRFSRSRRGIRNVAPLTAPDTSEALSHWVSDQEDVNLLVWFAKPDPEKPSMQAFVFGPWHDPEEGVPEADRRTLQSALGALRAR